MKRVIVASKNPVKIGAVAQGFSRLFPDVEWDIKGIPVPSGVSDQPFSDEETLQGALNRARALKAAHKADYYVGIEGGLEPRSFEGADQLEVFAWVVIMTPGSLVGKGRSSTFFLPQAITGHIFKGDELSVASDKVFNESHSGYKQGTIGILTDNVIDRTAYYVEPVIMALLPFKNPDLY